MKMRKELLCAVFMLTLLATIMPAMPVKASPASPVGIWHFDEGIGSVAYDSSGTMPPNDGTLSGGKFGNGLLFDGSGYVEVPDSASLEITGTITLEAWIFAESFGSGDAFGLQREIVGKWEDTNLGTASYILFTYGTKLRFHVSDTGYDAYSIEGSTDLLTNTWYHVAGVYDGTYLKVYVNGVSDATPVNIGTITIQQTSIPVRVGAYRYSGGWIAFFDGVIDEVRISDNVRYTVDFTPTGPFSTDANTMGLWHFDESVGTTAFDSSGLLPANDGAINGASWNGPIWTMDAKYGPSALSLDGTNDYVAVSDSASLHPSVFTIDVWIKPFIQSRWSRVLEKYWDAGTGARTAPYLSYALVLGEDPISGSISFLLGDGTTLYKLTSVQDAISDNVWTHIVATYDGSEMRLYINGVEDFNSPNIVSVTVAYSADPLYIGARVDPIYPVYFNGIIDEVRIYNTALSAEEIALHSLGVYGWTWLPPYKTKAGATLPLKFALYDAYGSFFSVPTGSTVKMELFQGPKDPASGGPSSSPPSWYATSTPICYATTPVPGVPTSTFPKDSMFPSNDYKLRISSDTYIVNWHTNIAPNTPGPYVAVFTWDTGTALGTFYWWNTYTLTSK